VAERRVEHRDLRGRHALCGPNTAVAPCAPVSGLSTSDIPMNSASFSRGSSADASIRAISASRAGTGSTG
jgi:hypothetical protein